MAYIESFLLYIAVVFFMFVVLFGGVVFLYMLFGQLKLFFVTEEVTFEKEKNFLYKLIKNKFFKFLILAYFAIFTFFYINKAVEYFGKDRAYPQAKAYKIVADLVLFHNDFFISNRNLYYRPIGLKFIEPYQKVQNYLMQKAFRYIPKDDAERAIWKYEYFYSQYIRAMAAPIDFEKLTPNDLGYILRIGGHPTIYKPQAKEMLIEVEYLLDMLMTNPMKDKYYDAVNRYTTTILFSQWWQKFSFLHYTLGARTVDEEMSKEHQKLLYQWTDDKEYISRLKRLLQWLDITKDKIDNLKQLQKEIKKHKLLYPDLMGLRVKFISDLTYADMQNENNIGCNNKFLQQYLIYKTEFVKYAKTDRTYKNMNWHERWVSESLANDNLEDYLLSKYRAIAISNLEIDNSIDLDFDTVYHDLPEKTKKILKGFKNGR